MPVSTSRSVPFIESGVAMRALPGETVSGDMHVVKPFPNGVLLAVMDGLGHGDEATLAAKTAAATLVEHARESVISLLKRCHEALPRTRGVAMTLASCNSLEGTITWLGVGNVEGLLLRADASANPPTERVLLRGGVVGYQLPVLHAGVLPIGPGDLLIFATDGIRGDFGGDFSHSRPSGIETPQQIADRLLEKWFKGTDDALVLVVRYLGSPYG